jgi:preprotein translocase subunit SecA
MLAKLGMEEDMPIESGWVSKALENAQTKVEGHNFDIRKHVVEYDDVMNVHRDVIYTERTKVLEGADMRSNIFGMVEEELSGLIKGHLPARHEEAWDRELLIEDLNAIYPVSDETKGLLESSRSADEIEAAVLDDAEEAYDRREAEITPDNMRLLERLLLLQTIDRLWVEHLTAMDEMRQGIGLQAYGNQDPLVSYKREAHDMWEQLLENISNTVARAIYHVNLSQTPVQQQSPARVPVGAGAPRPQNLRENRSEEAAVPAARQNGRKIGRNDPCYCGSGKKYKRCHGIAA